MKLPASCCALFAVAAGAANADTVVKYDFGATYALRTLAPAIEASHADSGNFAYSGNGSPVDYATGSNGTGNSWSVTGGWNDTSYADYFYFSVTLESGWALDVTNLVFDSKTSSMYGPELARVTVTSGAEVIVEDDIWVSASGWTLANTISSPFPADLTGTVTFKIYAKDGGSTGGYLALDNVIVNGTVSTIPEPGICALAAAGGILFLRRRKA